MVVFSKIYHLKYNLIVTVTLLLFLINLQCPTVYCQQIGTYPWGNHITAEDRMQDIVS